MNHYRDPAATRLFAHVVDVMLFSCPRPPRLAQGNNRRLEFSLRSTWAYTRPSLAQLQLRQANLSPLGPSNLRMATHDPIGRQLLETPVFRVGTDGVLETLTRLDRETISSYLLKVAVRDMAGNNQSLTTHTVIRVDVLDENDNAPEWTFPTMTDRHINVSAAMRPGDLVVRLRAFDMDTDKAASVDYLVLGPRGEPLTPVSLADGLPSAIPGLASEASPMTTALSAGSQTPGKRPFGRPATGQDELFGFRAGPLYLNGSTGELWVADLLVPGNLNIHLRARDAGVPRRYSDTWLTVNIFADPNEGALFWFGGAGTLNVTIILAMIAVTAVISLLLIVAIVCVRRRPPATGVATVGLNGRYPSGLAAQLNGDYSASLSAMVAGGAATCGPGAGLGHGLDTAGGKEGLANALWTQGGYAGQGGLYGPAGPGSTLIDETGQILGASLANGLAGGTYGVIGLAPGGGLSSAMAGAGPVAGDSASMIFMPAAPPAAALAQASSGQSVSASPLGLMMDGAGLNLVTGTSGAGGGETASAVGLDLNAGLQMHTFGVS
ncbi:unnamed protein product [Protopolystoma xenopodis]|uniref:Cadherin domain-containing protein n=1 Tax=Protopolystoma xenopodis TaxID=117903 RepID=A0A3S5CSM6_9PLAT|nr:unnamed protein product [Protopolystoma xenopodis]